MSLATQAFVQTSSEEPKLVNQLDLGREEVESFERDGFLRIKGLFTPHAIEGIKQQLEDWIEGDQINEDGTISRFASRRDEGPFLKQIMSHPGFRDVFTTLTGRKLIFTEAQAFELSKGGTGLPWHFTYIGLGFIRARDMGYTLWVPTSPVDAKKTGGGMAYVSESVFSARHGYDIGSLLASRLNNNEDISALLEGFERAHEELRPVLEENRVEDDFDVGDAFLFSKYVWHRSAPFLSDDSTRRLGVALRFCDWEARKDNVRWKAEYDFGGGIITGQKKYVYGAKGEDRFARFVDVEHGQPLKFSKEVRTIV